MAPTDGIDGDTRIFRQSIAAGRPDARQEFGADAVCRIFRLTSHPGFAPQISTGPFRGIAARPSGAMASPFPRHISPALNPQTGRMRAARSTPDRHEIYPPGMRGGRPSIGAILPQLINSLGRHHAPPYLADLPTTRRTTPGSTTAFHRGPWEKRIRHPPES